MYSGTRKPGRQKRGSVRINRQRINKRYRNKKSLSIILSDSCSVIFCLIVVLLHGDLEQLNARAVKERQALVP
jgi:hypothetical protein